MTRCAHLGCPAQSTGKSKYCPTHKKEARTAWVQMISAKADERDARYASFEKLYQQAHAAGVSACVERIEHLVPMIVQQHAQVGNDNSPVVEQWVARGGPCGMSWVTIYPGTSSFARWLAKEQNWKPGYNGGVTKYMHVPAEAIGEEHTLSQSYDLHTAYARAFSKVLNDAGYKARSYARED
jgi:hypothetical protein